MRHAYKYKMKIKNRRSQRRKWTSVQRRNALQVRKLTKRILKEKKTANEERKTRSFFLILLFVDFNIYYCLETVNNICCGFLQFFAKIIHFLLKFLIFRHFLQTFIFLCCFLLFNYAHCKNFAKNTKSLNSLFIFNFLLYNMHKIF